MNRYERIFMVILLMYIAIAAISWIGQRFFALLALFELLVGVVIGMVIFLQNREGVYK